jgi:hypothetical protein
MLDPPTPQNLATEKRTEPRYGCRRLVRVRRALDPGAQSRLASVLNVSTRGIGLLLTEPVPPETVLEIEMQGQSIVKRFVRVVHSTQQEDGWLVGCSLSSSLSAAELQRLLK